MKSAFKATAILGSSSLIAILLGLVSSKAYALLIGPSGIGYMGLLQSLLSLTTMVLGLGAGQGLVRLGANALGRDAGKEFAAFCRAAWLMLGLLGGGGAILLILLREQASLYMLGSPEHQYGVVLVGIAALLSLAAVIDSSTINALHRIRVLAKISVATNVLSICVSIPLVAAYGIQGIPFALISTALIGFILARFYVRREALHRNVEIGKSDIIQALKVLLKFGAPYTASMLVGTGVQLIIPILVLHQLGTESVGFFRAASVITGSYMSFLLTALTQDYYPRLSAADDTPGTVSLLINQQQQLILVLGVPLILGVISLAPLLVPLIYSAKFAPAISLLKWQMAANLFKFSTWTMSYAILARCKSHVYFVTELLAGLILVSSIWLCTDLFGLEGLGIGFLITYLLFFLIEWAVVNRTLEFRWTRMNKVLMLASTSAVSLLLMTSFFAGSKVQIGVSVTLTVIASAFSLRVVWREVKDFGFVRRQWLRLVGQN